MNKYDDLVFYWKNGKKLCFKPKNKISIKRKIKNGKTYYVKADEEQISGAISGARNPDGEKAKEHAKKYYGLVRSMTTDVPKIAKITGYTEEEIQKVKDYIFLSKHNLDGRIKYFDPDYMMAESWQRLIEGKPVQHDITLIKHEIYERKLVEKGYSQDKAHLVASKMYNYNKEAREFYGKIKKYKKD